MCSTPEGARSRTTTHSGGARDAIPAPSSTPRTIWAANADTRRAGIHPLDHYHQARRHEGPRPGGEFRYNAVSGPQSGRGRRRYRSAGALSGERHGRRPRPSMPAVGPRSITNDGKLPGAQSRTSRRLRQPPERTTTSIGRHEGRNPNAFFDSARLSRALSRRRHQSAGRTIRRSAGTKGATRRRASIRWAISKLNPGRRGGGCQSARPTS